MDNTISHRNQMILFIILFGIMTITGCSKDQDTKTAKTRDQILVDNMEHAEDYYEMNPYFKEAFEFLKRSDLADLPAGRHEIDGPSEHPETNQDIYEKDLFQRIIN